MSVTNELIDFVNTRREQRGLIQQELADRAGVGLRFVRDLEHGKREYAAGQDEPAAHSDWE